MKYSRDFLFHMPKTDLHLHLDGSMRAETLIRMARKLKIELPSYTIDGLNELVFKENYQNLGEYLKGFAYTCKALRDLEHIEEASYELAIDAQNENVFYIEVRFAPQLFMSADAPPSMQEIFVACNKGLKRAQDEFNAKDLVKTKEIPEFKYGIIACAMRMFGPKGYSNYYSSLYQVMGEHKISEITATAAMELVKNVVKIRDELGLPIVGLDLAGEEAGHPPHHFKLAYAYAHKNFLNKTIHAGEAYGAESIFEAITECHAERLGHGHSLYIPSMIQDRNILNKNKFCRDLSSYIADRRITVEVCLTSNQQTNPAFLNIKNHPFGHMLNDRLALTLCTDNRLISKTDMTSEFILATSNFDIPLKRLKDIVAYGLKKSFYFGHYVDKRQYSKTVMEYFDKVAKKYGVKN